MMNISFLLVIAYGLFIWLIFLITARVEREEEKTSPFVLDDWDIDLQSVIHDRYDLEGCLDCLKQERDRRVQ